MQLPARLQNRQLAEHKQIAGALSAGLGSTQPPYISIMGGAFTLIDASGEQIPVETKHLDCVIFDVNMDVAVQRVFWGLGPDGQPKQFDDSGSPPSCFSDNGIGASRNATKPESAQCATCQYKAFNWVSKRDPSKRSSACRPIKKIAVVVPGYDIPFLLRVPVTSHENLLVYANKFKGQKFDAPDVVTRISFVHGEVGQLNFDAVGFTDDETDALVQKLTAANAGDMLVGRGDVAIGALPSPQIASQPAAPQPALQAPAQPPAQAPVFAPEPAPVKRGRKSKAEPAPAQGAPFAATNGEGDVPPFLRRDQPAASQPAFMQPQPAHGIQQNVPSPTAEMEKQLDSIFGLKT